MRGIGEIGERVRRSTVQVFNGAVHFLRDDRTRVREAVVLLTAPMEAAA
jgi:hypothetical protein